MTDGVLITLEGVEGSGKTTQAAILAAELIARGYPVTTTREPGGTGAGKLMRAIFLDRAVSLTKAAELLLVLADRSQHVSETLRPALAAGSVVISDRYSDSTIAYQGYGRGLDLRLLRELNGFASDDLSPVLTIVLDCPVEVGLERIQSRASGTAYRADRFEGEQLEFHRRVRQGFLSLARENPSRIVVFDATREPRAVSADILQAVIARLEQA